MDKKILIISGPTASGKSGLALSQADSQDIAIINADALQLYRGLPILSAQPNEDEKKKVEHRLYSVLDPQENSSVGLWLKLVKSAIEEVWGKNKLPVIVGGTGMYISKLVDGISEIPEIDESLKIKARQHFEEVGKEKFQQELLALGEEKEKIEKLDKQRLIRLYEIFQQTGKTLSWWQKQGVRKIFSDADFSQIKLMPEREELYQNCNSRFEKMLQFGAIEEVQSLVNQGVTDDWPISKTLGFCEIRDFLAGKITREKMIELATQKTRNYAKRQLTWFRHH